MRLGEIRWGQPGPKIGPLLRLALEEFGDGLPLDNRMGAVVDTRGRAVSECVVDCGDKVAHVDGVVGRLGGDLVAHLEAMAYNETHRDNVARHIRRIREGCRFAFLADLDRNTLEKWLARQTKNGMGARTRNIHLASAIAFANWCLQPDNGRLLTNPFTGIAKADERVDCRRKRRVLCESELVRLLEVARRRPLLDAMTIRRGRNKGKPLANVSEENRLRLEQLGRERALIYKMMVLTGLRKGELTTLEVGQIELDGSVSYLGLDPADEKNREGNEIPLRNDLADDLRGWLADKLNPLQEAARRRGEPIPSHLPADTKIFRVPDKLVRILDRDLKLAGIPKTDDRGRTIDVHALRHSFGTLLSKGGVAPRTAQAAMRHSTIDLTMNNYVDPRLLDIHGALDALPALPIEGNSIQGERATGTEDLRGGLHPFAPGFAPKADKSSESRSISDNGQTDVEKRDTRTGNVVSLDFVSRKKPLTAADNGCQQMETRGLEPLTPGLQSRCSPN